MKDKFVLMYNVAKNILHITNLTEVNNNEKIKNDPDNFLIDIFDDITHCLKFQEDIKPEFMAVRDFHSMGHFGSVGRDSMKYSLLYDNEEFCFKVNISTPELSDRFSLIANFDSGERCNIVGNILMDHAEEKDISLQAAYMQFLNGQLHTEYKIKSIELTYQELKKEAAIKPATGVVKIENPVMKFTISIDIVFENFIGSTSLGSKGKEMAEVVVYKERIGNAFEGYTAKGSYFYVPNELLKNAIIFVTEDK